MLVPPPLGRHLVFRLMDVGVEKWNFTSFDASAREPIQHAFACVCALCVLVQLLYVWHASAFAS